MAEIGDQVGNIRIVELLGAGGMGNVYLGFDETLQRKVALKAITGRYRMSADARSRFLREARMLSRLKHPGICQIHDFVQHGEDEFLVLELIEGETLEAAVRGRDLAPQLKLKIARDVVTVLTVAHAEGIIHRDLKPGNVMLTPNGEVKVLDFGLARSVEEEPQTVEPQPSESAIAELDAVPAELGEATVTWRPAAPNSGSAAADDELALVSMRTAPGSLLGTPHFMSPEQARGEALTTASDMYSLGLVLQFLFTGMPPYDPDLDLRGVLRSAARAETLPPVGVSAELSALIDRLKSAAPAVRPTAVEALRRLEWIAEKPRRRNRRLAVAAVVALLALGGLKYTVDLRRERATAVAAEEVAERRRGQAESLIGFMLGDLRNKLEPIGRQEILEDVGDKALEYFASVPEADLTDTEVLRRAEALRQIGWVRLAVGDPDAAADVFQRSMALVQGLVEKDPDHVEWQKELGTSHFWLGRILWDRGDVDGALARFQKQLEIARSLAERDPENLDLQGNAAFAFTNLGFVQRARGDLEGALEAYRSTLEIREALADREPENPDRQLALADQYNLVGWILMELGQLEAAREYFAADEAIAQAHVARDPANTLWLEQLAQSHNYLGRALHALGERVEARQHFREHLEIAERLVATDAANTSWQVHLAIAHRWVGIDLMERGQIGPALDESRQGLEILAALVAKDPERHRWQRDLACAHLGTGEILAKAGELEGARREALAAIARLQPLVEKNPSDRESHRWLSEAHLLLAGALSGLGQPAAATGAWQRAADLIAPFARGSQDRRFLEPWAEALLHLGRDEEAESIRARLEFKRPAA